jgi:hypothetical protein
LAWQEEGKKEKEKEARRRERKEAERAAKIKEDDALTRAAAAQAWSMHTDPEGRKYYHNPITSVTTWDMPDELRARSRSDELKERQADEAAASPAQRSSHASSSTAVQQPPTEAPRAVQHVPTEVQQPPTEVQQAAYVSRVVSVGKLDGGDHDGATNDPSNMSATKVEYEVEYSNMSAKQLRKFCAARNVEVPDGAGVEQVRVLALAHRNLPPVTWQRTKAPDGRDYYYNPKTKMTSWTNPEPLVSDQPSCHESAR